MKIFLTFMLTLFLFSPVTWAETEKEAEELQKILDEAAKKAQQQKLEDEKNRYAPDFCDFEITFPEQPYTAKRCPEGVGKCYDLTSYTMVYDLTTTVDVSVTCVPSSPANYKRYSERVIKAALNGMVRRVGVDQFNINTREEENMRQGSLIGAGKQGRQNKIYNAQLWVGQNSVFTVEAQLVGSSHREADTVFSDILKSMKVKESDG